MYKLCFYVPEAHLEPVKKAVFAAGGTPELAELKLHNGTIYRWNRPVYDIAGGVAHLRVENRVLPAGPTIARTRWMFGVQRRLVRRCECEMLLPKIGPFAQTSQLAATGNS